MVKWGENEKYNISAFQNSQIQRIWVRTSSRDWKYVREIGNPEKIQKNVKKKERAKISPKSKK